MHSARGMRRWVAYSWRFGLYHDKRRPHNAAVQGETMSFRQISALLLISALACAPTVMAAPPSPWDTTKVVTEATSGQFKATQGKYFDKECNASLDYTTEVVDLNDDGQPEVFTS